MKALKTMLLLLTSLAGPMTRGATWTVNSYGDEADPSDGLLTLREAIAASASADTINFALGVGFPISLTNELVIDHDLNIQGQGAARLSISGNNASRIFRITRGNVTISGLTITDGYSSLGGAIHNSGTLTLSACNLQSNLAYTAVSTLLAWGGAIFNNTGSVTLAACTLNGNVARADLSGADGGGIYNYWGSISLINCTLHGNCACGAGAGGGAITADGGSTTLLSCTVSGNQVSGYGPFGVNSGGGLSAGGTTKVKSTLISGNLALAGPQSHADGPDVAGMVIDQGFNFVGITNGSSGWHLSDFTGNADDPLTPHAGLGPLQYNGGPTPTMALLPSSWVVDQGQSSGVSTDQRGEPRTYDYLFLYFASPFGGDGTDIGAYEVQGPVVTSQPQSQFIAAGQNAVFTVSVNSPAGAPWYQWHKDFTDVNGVGFSRIVDATNATYTRTNVQLADAGEYSVMIGDAYTPGIPFYGALRSSSAKLRVGYALNRSMVGGGIIVPSLDVPVYTNNSSVVLFASPAPGWIFSHWSGDTNGAQNPLPIVMATNRFITANFTSTVSACAVSPLGLVGWWPGEGNANDIIGTNNGTVQNGVAYAAGKVGQAFDLDGASADVYIPASPTLQFSTQFTIEAWVRPNDVATNRQILLLADPFEGFCLLEASTNGSVRLYVGGDSGGPTQTSDSLNSPAGLLSVGTWAHVAGSFQNGQLLLFVNGITVAAKLSRLFSIFALPPAGYIGGVTGSGHQRFFGSIDELSVYNRALGEAEIRAIYAAGNSGKCAPPCASSPAGLVSWWPGASTANDIAGANDGALQNGVAFATGQVGQAFSFDGVDDFVSVANTASMDFGVSDFSIDLWFKLNALASDQAFFHKSVGNVPGDQTYLLEFDAPNSLRFLVRGTSANQNDLTVPTSLAAGRWYHLAAVREGNTSSLYVNAALIGRQTAGASVDTGSGGTAAMGKLAPNGTGVNRFLRGYLDEVDLFNRALAQSEVQAIYNAGTLGKCLAPAFITSAIRSGNNLNINWLSKRGLTYRAQYKTNLDTITSWQDVVGDVTATNTTATKTDLLPASTFQRFYRVEMFR